MAGSTLEKLDIKIRNLTIRTYVNLFPNFKSLPSLCESLYVPRLTEEHTQSSSHFVGYGNKNLSGPVLKA